MKSVAVAVISVALAASAWPGPAAAAPTAYAYAFACNPDSLSADFAQRDQLPETDAPQWNDGWGPKAAALPPVQVPDGVGCDAATWRRERVVATAMRYLNEPDNPQALQYRHHHIPDWDPPMAGGRGLDCSNFTAWVYNYGLGIHFGGNVHRQYDGTAGPMGQQLSAQGPFEPGDLVYLHPDDDPAVASHVGIYLDETHVIDSRGDARGINGVQVRQRTGWYLNAILGGWRPAVPA